MGTNRLSRPCDNGNRATSRLWAIMGKVSPISAQRQNGTGGSTYHPAAGARPSGCAAQHPLVLMDCAIT